MSTPRELVNDHGWGAPVEMVGEFGVVFVANSVDERERCQCPRDWCARAATQEDLRCDECREVCR